MRSRSSLICGVVVLLMCTLALGQLPSNMKLPTRNKPPVGQQQQPDVDVQRGRGGTPEVSGITPRVAVAGKVMELTLALKNATLTPLEVKGFGACQKISNVHVSGPQEVKFSIDLTGVNASSYCDGQLVAGRRYLPWSIHVLSAEEAKRVAEQEATMKKYQEKQAADISQAKSALGKVWSVEFATGERDTWTLVSTGNDGVGQFSTSSGKMIKVAVLPQANNSVVVDMGGQCGLNGQKHDNQVSGMVMSPKCKWQFMTQWAATIK